MVEQGDGEAEVAAVGVVPGPGPDRRLAAEGLHPAAGLLGRRVLPQVGGVAVEPAHVALVDGLDVVAERAVVAAVRPDPFERGREAEGLGDLGAGQAPVDLADGLVVQVAVEVPLVGEELDDGVVAPGGPVVGGEGDVGGPGVEADGLGEVAGPGVGVADLGAAQG
ncbi:hypothetical protein Shyd_84060 [Streptomyces hydrogenans]|uniref:Uncharacterized protein n=1 Tax=Streptomyces hydrogenans TaxID=1873719 RepID=A0ABQ3PPV5_9ACTN|nr:hypothetical protein Shyd_84060 [Streptomyces hydrogenans]